MVVMTHPGLHQPCMEWSTLSWISDCGIRCRLSAASGGSVQRIGYSILKPATARDYRQEAVVGQVLFFASPTTDVRKGFRMNLYHALIADGGRYVGVASFHSPPTHCRKTKGGVGVRKRPPPVSLRNPLLTPRLLDRYAPLCLRGPRVVGVS